MKPTRYLNALPLLLAIGLAACAAPVAPQASGIETPSTWSRLWGKDKQDASPDLPLATTDAADIEQRWWKSFGDPTLDRLIDGALANNKTLQIAEARVAEARASRGGAEANLLPTVSATGSVSRGNQGYATSNRPISIREIDLQASWEIDVFGKNQARVAEATAILQSEDARRQAVLVSLLAEVARNYFDARNDQEQLAITRKNLDTQRRTLDLIKVQLRGGLSSDLDVTRAAAQVSTTSAQLPALQSAYEVTLDRLNVLLGYSPGTKDAWLEAGGPLQPLAPTVLVAAPARVLANRPDVRSAERSFAASISASDVASKEIYPTISLTGLFGVQDSSLFNATPWGIGAGLVQPVLNFGRIQSEIDVADARQKQAFLSYQETVLEALEDMENALSLYLHETGRRRDLDLAAEQNRKAVDLANRQYTAGYSGLLDLLVAQRDELEAESNLASSNAQLRKNLVHIYTAAGGGWKL
ncbi:MAG TPA: TolC family protein [Stellaceae bacterium]|nr:TolC family protein [Stellaceae bacterium]